ncbi:S41 family peptidase [Chitinophaga arvensicola]|uniref:C-terminal processing protease CtpA/Prc, contains a PDZ domain n=1 Tax=Chitinophaga arvensicola TaxID=29529 RepID=A0A1I0SB81_9BACT|nr:S41 family peptidase [Chitinophaga arvensicola]SEW53944.1 C-terminal processing protease CtpA/Prc, contains a PDZ domain [Chitinophaga arvensicola]
MLTRTCLLLFFPLYLLARPVPQDADTLYATASLKADFHFLKQRLKKLHPALYRYTSKKEMKVFLDSLEKVITHPMTQQAFLSHISLLNEKIRDGHTMFLPGKAAINFNRIQGKFLPLQVFPDSGQLYILANYSGNDSLHAGDEILAINHQSAREVLTQLIRRMVRDGSNQTYPIWILRHYFSAYYSFTFGQPTEFLLTVRDTSGVISTHTVAAVSSEKIRASHSSAGITLAAFPSKPTAAMLTVPTFDSSLLAARYHQDFNTTIDSFFHLIQQRGIKDLVLDLRNNQGGDFAPGRYLLGYLLKQPSVWLYNGKKKEMITPVSGHFTGRLFVLVNGGTFSSAAIVSACLEKNTAAIFAGEETGGNTYIISGNPFEFTLPNTGIQCFISTTNYIINPYGSNSGHGLIPEFVVPVHMQYMLMTNDPMLRFLEWLLDADLDYRKHYS